jgi:putative ABC transport system permease protein
MTFARLAVRNLSRNKLRATLTVAGVATAIVAFLLLRTVMGTWAAGARSAPTDRIVTRHRISLALPLPRRYVDDGRGAAHVRATTWMSGFGGKDPSHPAALFGSAAVDAATFFEVYSEMKLPAAELERFMRDRRGAVVGDQIAAKLGWALGDRITLVSGFYPGDWQFTVDGIYTAAAKSANGSNVLIRWDGLNDSLGTGRGDKDTVGLIVSRVDDPSRAAGVGLELDRLFEQREPQTISQDERSVAASFVAMYSAVLRALDVISIAILVIMTLILGNTIAMGVRERSAEYGVLRAIGFRPGHVARWIVAESLALGLLGGVVGALLAWPFINVLVRQLVDETVGSFFPSFRLDAAHVAAGIGLSGALGAAAAALPAWRASKLGAVEAVRRVA